MRLLWHHLRHFPSRATRKIDSSKLTKVTELNTSQLLYSILAVMPPSADDSDEFEGALESPIAGFYVLEVDEGSKI